MSSISISIAISFYIAIPACVLVVLVCLHAIHEDHATTFHFEQKTGILLEHSRPEYAPNIANGQTWPNVAAHSQA